jgi:hypothetical protein
VSVGVDLDVKGDVPITMTNTVPVGVSGSLSSIGPVGPVTVDGIPDTFHFYLEKLPKIQIGADPISVSIEKLPKIQVGMDPVALNIAVKEIPSLRTHIPADYSLGVSILGLDLLCFRLCGEAQIITEPYKPNPCERCGELSRTPTPTPTPTPQPTPGFTAASTFDYPSADMVRFQDNR